VKIALYHYWNYFSLGSLVLLDYFIVANMMLSLFKFVLSFYGLFMICRLQYIWNRKKESPKRQNCHRLGLIKPVHGWYWKLLSSTPFWSLSKFHFILDRQSFFSFMAHTWTVTIRRFSWNDKKLSHQRFTTVEHIHGSILITAIQGMNSA
jgi:hypothetical protein